MQLVLGPNVLDGKRTKLVLCLRVTFATGGPAIMSFDLIMAICLATAVLILGAAFVWALMETRQAGVHRKKYRLSHHIKSRKQSAKARDR
jgi:hypothetical protein